MLGAFVRGFDEGAVGRGGLVLVAASSGLALVVAEVQFNLRRLLSGRADNAGVDAVRAKHAGKYLFHRGMKT